MNQPSRKKWLSNVVVIVIKENQGENQMDFTCPSCSEEFTVKETEFNEDTELLVDCPDCDTELVIKKDGSVEVADEEEDEDDEDFNDEDDE